MAGDRPACPGEPDTPSSTPTALMYFDKPLEKPTVDITCDTVINSCNYVLQNISAGSMEKIIRQELFGSGFLSPLDGKLFHRSQYEIVFWHRCPSILAQMKHVILKNDRLVDYPDLPEVDITVSVFSITNTGLTQLNARIDALTLDIDGTEKPEFNAEDDGVKFSINVWSARMTAFLGGGIERQEIENVEILNQPSLLNGSYFSPERERTTYFSPADGQVQELVGGLEASGKIIIPRSPKNNKIIIENFNFRYGVIDPLSKDTVDVLDASPTVLNLRSGVSKLIVRSSRELRLTSQSSGFIRFNRRKEKVATKVLIVVTAHILTPEEIEQRYEEIEKEEKNVKFSAEDIAKFPKNKVSVEKAVKSIKAYSRLIAETQSWAQIIKLDSSFARINNIYKNVRVRISGGGFTQKDELTIENLMKEGIVFQELPYKNREKTRIHYKVRFYEVRKHWWQLPKRIHTEHLYYNPKRHKFMDI